MTTMTGGFDEYPSGGPSQAAPPLPSSTPHVGELVVVMPMSFMR
ncbi:MAG: hypothetical protein ACRDXC_01555 [Acidimicrobiales bacterium]